MATKKATRAKKTSKSTKKPSETSDEALLAKPASYADAPDIPIAVAIQESKKLAALATKERAALLRVGVERRTLDALPVLSKRFAELERAWTKERQRTAPSVAKRKDVADAEAIKREMLDAGAWACRKDAGAIDELAKIREGTGIVDLIQDLRDLVEFWRARPKEMKFTRVTDRHLSRGRKLADSLSAGLDTDGDAPRAQELRNRCYWTLDELAKEVRSGGRYAFTAQPKIAAQFVARYKAERARAARRRSKAKNGEAPQPPA
jgi:hypothetical protein